MSRVGPRLTGTACRTPPTTLAPLPVDAPTLLLGHGDLRQWGTRLALRSP